MGRTMAGASKGSLRHRFRHADTDALRHMRFVAKSYALLAKRAQERRKGLGAIAEAQKAHPAWVVSPNRACNPCFSSRRRLGLLTPGNG